MLGEGLTSSLKVCFSRRTLFYTVIYSPCWLGYLLHAKRIDFVSPYSPRTPMYKPCRNTEHVNNLPRRPWISSAIYAHAKPRKSENIF